MVRRITATFALLASAVAAIGQTTAPQTTLPDGPVAQATKPSAVAVSLFWENDGGFTNLLSSTDRYYTSGTAIAVQWQDEATSDIISKLPSIGGEFDAGRPGTSYAAGLELSLRMDTPSDLSSPQPLYGDQPYSGWAYIGFIAQRANRQQNMATFESWELDLGTVGQTSQAGKIQTWLHRNFDEQNVPQGWMNQVKDDFGGDLKYLRRYRFNLGTFSSLGDAQLQLIPDVGATVGTQHDYAGAGATLRFGWNLPDDAGPARISYLGDFTQGAADAAKPTGAYFFVRPGGQYVYHDVALDGSWFRENTVTVTPHRWVGDVEFGFAFQFAKHWELAYYETATSQSFHGQDDWQVVASIMLRGTWTW